MQNAKKNVKHYEKKNEKKIEKKVEKSKEEKRTEMEITTADENLLLCVPLLLHIMLCLA